METPAAVQPAADAMRVCGDTTPSEIDRGRSLEEDREEDTIRWCPKIQRCLQTRKSTLASRRVAACCSQFRTIYGPRFLFLAPPNEFGVPKFVSTTIRPTKLPFKECYDYRECAAFFADFLCYEELDPPNQYPPVLPSPSSVMTWRKGDSFDYAVLLCSVLIGHGYDAFCVSGCAPEFITRVNQTNDLPSFLREQMTPEAKPAQKSDSAPSAGSADEVPTSADAPPAGELRVVPRQEDDDDVEFVVPRRLPPESGFLKMLEDEAHEKEAAKQAESERIFVDGDDSLHGEDPFEGQRVHCWVLIKKGKRGMENDVFLEPTTGRAYTCVEAPYISVHFVWNNENFWVNMADRVPVRQLTWDLYNTRFFEFILLKKSKALQAPVSWGAQLKLTRDDIVKRYYGLGKTVFYRNSKVENFALYSQPDGLVRRVTLFKDAQRTLPYQIWETFKQRRDCMYERVRYPDERKVMERYLPGTPNSLKEVIEVEAVKRELVFYKSRLDGLIRHVEVIGVKMFEEFEDREDRRTYQSITLGTDEDSSREKIRKEAKDDEYKIVYLLGEGRVRISFHHADGAILQPVLMLKRIHRYLMRQKEMVMRFRNFVVDQAYQIHVWRGQQEAAITAARELEEKHLLALREGVAGASRPLFPSSERGARAAYGSDANGAADADKPNAQQTEEAPRRQNAEENAGPPIYTKHTLQPTVYDAARELLKTHTDEKEARETKQKKRENEEIDILAPYFIEFRGRPLDAATAELIAKRCKNDMRAIAKLNELEHLLLTDSRLAPMWSRDTFG
ncbi:hypothetical protein BESB_066870 [Besnoitia besnoiti]|uniref:Dynein regulatory complex subunit 7 n=1 Tax=Besnoitia besnoiti TaxID=94643 RepID=A0A2A9MBQ3_BESBE|nr:hypothetical protein BESB_066870 [Besnoitia besnoiti]PFH34654.1 hypothetical protein BESB_066870 [Besnoitia besnoiti]